MGIITASTSTTVTVTALDDTDEGLMVVLEIDRVLTDGGFELGVPKKETKRVKLGEAIEL